MEVEDIEDVVTTKPLNFIDDEEKMETIIRTMVKERPSSKKKMRNFITRMQKKHKIQLGNANLLYVFREMVRNGKIDNDESLTSLLVVKKVRFLSGVNVITVMTSAYPGKTEDGRPEKFSCPYDCHYCPDEPGHEGNDWVHQPRSYLFDEPSVHRANRNGFDPVLQFRDRAKSYIVNGHQLSKCEVLVLGGTWSSYPEDYKYDFVRDLFYAANTFFDCTSFDNMRERKSLQEEKEINEKARCRIIGLTMETRPDKINKKELINLRNYGVTRVQLGIQHTDDRILDVINRQCPTKITKRSIKLLKDNCFKIDIHLMPDLPSSDPEKDLKMFKEVLYDEDLQVDQWKIYPCEIVPWTKIKQWYEEGSYKPYAEEKIKTKVNYQEKEVESTPLFELLIKVKERVHPWIRLNRVIRDIPGNYIIGGNKITNLRQFLQQEMKKRGLRCDCIRCREVKDKPTDLEKAVPVVRKYLSSGGTEYFLSYEDPDGTLYGFLRLRLSPDAGKGRNGVGVFPELFGTALIRELHVYGAVVAVSKENKEGSASQHYGFGSKLMILAEHIARYNGFSKMAVISGVGVKEYYRNKHGYEDEGFFQTKIISRLDSQNLDIDVIAYDFNGDGSSTSREIIRFRKNRDYRMVASIIVFLMAVLFYFIYKIEM